MYAIPNIFLSPIPFCKWDKLPNATFKQKTRKHKKKVNDLISLCEIKLDWLKAIELHTYVVLLAQDSFT